MDGFGIWDFVAKFSCVGCADCNERGISLFRCKNDGSREGREGDEGKQTLVLWMILRSEATEGRPGSSTCGGQNRMQYMDDYIKLRIGYNR